jgi:hypothetical protein
LVNPADRFPPAPDWDSFCVPSHHHIVSTVFRCITSNWAICGSS